MTRCEIYLIRHNKQIRLSVDLKIIVILLEENNKYFTSWFVNCMRPVAFYIRNNVVCLLGSIFFLFEVWSQTSRLPVACSNINGTILTQEFISHSVTAELAFCVIKTTLFSYRWRLTLTSYSFLVQLFKANMQICSDPEQNLLINRKIWCDNEVESKFRKLKTQEQK